MEEHFVSQISALVRAQNRNLLRLANFARIAGGWFYASAVVGIFSRKSEWKSFMVSTFMSSASLAAQASEDMENLQKLGMIADSALCLFMVRSGQQGPLMVLHVIISLAQLLVYANDDSSILVSSSVAKPGYALAMLVVCPMALLVARKLREKVAEMEAGLARLEQSDVLKQD